MLPTEILTLLRTFVACDVQGYSFFFWGGGGQRPASPTPLNEALTKYPCLNLKVYKAGILT